mmetsp:Transcript_2656/g.3004  ORF Transcript_2656/g.3004 Transcript_2656/m.3004 type:complete len:131 (-) Transcript_2656:726-1118(-)|eukprot:CAMPEP_0184013954 /NCGR_PEP_ID=MMETSP0954-20121128/5333_1 /TAXON_ID=627963 /ORGANISM="Aplanochytrium sp, Strain PBS07" /LENGTH=130 /DNA_ID=CAMNT_0026294267 /DNA_START=424 /DNA_END=816 /DNA_ORIENTATION=+
MDSKTESKIPVAIESENKRTENENDSVRVKEKNKDSLLLQVDGSKKSGILTTAVNSLRVNILKVNNKGDALIHDGTRIMMVAAQHVRLPNAEDIGFKRLQFIKKLYSLLLKGDSIDTAKVFVEASYFGVI